MRRAASGTTLAALAGLCAVVLAGCGLQEGLAQRPDSSQSPSMAPAITGATLDGAAFSWASLRGHPIVLDFWASWCGPCRAEQAELNQLAAGYGPRGVVFLGVDVRDDNAAANAYRHELSVSYPSVIDSDEQISSAYDVAAPPTVIVVDANGRIVDRFLGTLAGLSAALERVTR